MSAANYHNDANDANDQNRKTILLRIGVNLGDVMVEGSDLYGDGVNLAARLEAIAEPGMICISAKVRDEVEGKIDLKFDDMGEVKLKNMPRPVRLFTINPAAGRQPPEAQVTPDTLALPSKPSLAVLPFDNLSGDPAQEYFADGVVEEIITALSRMRWLFVIARNSSFTYKGRAIDVKQVGRELGVRYVLEGSVRQAGKRVRITGQLIDAGTGAHLWADRFDGGLEDIFDLQEQVTSSVVGAIAPRLEQAEIDRAKRKPTESLGAYDYYLRGLAAVNRWTREESDQALTLFRRAIELDPDFSSAYGMAARCYSQRKVSGWILDRQKETAKAEWFARRAAELGRDDAVALAAAGITFAYVLGDLDQGAAVTARAIDLNSNLASGWLWSGWIKVWLGESGPAIQHLERAMRLSPHDPQLMNMQAAMAAAHFFAGRYAEALPWAESAMRDNPRHLMPPTTAAASNALAGRMAEARKAVARILEIDPSMSLSNLGEFIPLRRSEDMQLLADGLRKAGLPE
jgi:TolB-like protein/tetratricopeptide (TPR) repeat protein